MRLHSLTRTNTIATLFIVICIVGYGCSGRFDRNAYAERSANNVYDTQVIKPTDWEKRQKRKKGYVYVTKVIDGDTFWVDDGSNELKVRFIGIDAPETRNAGRKKKGHFGEEAKDYVVRLTEHRWVRLELDIQEKDPYQRLLAYIYLEDGTFLNAHLVANGYAVIDTYPPNVKYVDLFTDLQQQARREKRGLWAE